MTMLPLVNAQAVAGKYNVPTWSYISPFPTPIGVGQTISLFGWEDKIPPTANGEYGDRWYNLTIIVTKPDGTTTIMGPYTSDPAGCIFEYYVPTTTGTYSFQLVFPGQLLAGNNLNPVQVAAGNNSIQGFSDIGNYYEPSRSDSVTVQVQSKAIPPAPANPLPTGYWSAPIYQAGNQFYEYIMGDWLSFSQVGANINDYTQPPTTAHIAWTLPVNFGGVGGLPSVISTGGDNYYSGLSYENQFPNGVIMDGQLYYSVGHAPLYGFVDVNLQTGQQTWYQNGTANTPWNGLAATGATPKYPQLSFGQELDYESPNQHGIQNFLWSTYTAPNGSSVWSMYDAFSGNWIKPLERARNECKRHYGPDG